MDVSSTPPYLRDVNTVFQDYALFPHMSVLQNVAYGLRVKGVAIRERDERAAEALAARPARRLRAAQAGAAVRRPAPARRARARHRQLAPRPAARRAARRARPEAARADAGRAEGDPAGPRHHLPLRHARPGRGADDERPDRRLQRGPDRAGRHARGDLRASRSPSSSPASSASRTCSSATAGASPIRPEKIEMVAGDDGARRDRDGQGRHLRRRVHALHRRSRPGGTADSHAPEPRDHLRAGARGERPARSPRVAARAHVHDRGRRESHE